MSVLAAYRNRETQEKAVGQQTGYLRLLREVAKLEDLETALRRSLPLGKEYRPLSAFGLGSGVG